jgi:ABC-type polysaccharide/polyol phosphate transport system, ATPase component
LPEIDAAFPEIAAFAHLGDFIRRPLKTYSLVVLTL